MPSTVGCIVTVLLLDVTLGANDASFNEWATFLEQGDLEKQHVQYRISDINNSLDYFNAQSYCEAVGGYLAEPKTEDEIKILRVIILEAGPRNNWWIGARLNPGRTHSCVSGDSVQPAHYDWKNSQIQPDVGRKRMGMAQCVRPYHLDRKHPIQKTGGFIWPRTGRLILHGFWAGEMNYKTLTNSTCVKISHEFSYNWTPEDCMSDRSGNHPIRAICERRLVVTRMPKSEVEALFLAVNCFGCGQKPTDKLGGISLDKTGCRRNKAGNDKLVSKFYDLMKNRTEDRAFRSLKKRSPAVSMKYNEPLDGFLEKEPSSGQHSRHVYLPSSFVIHFDEQKCDMKSQTQAHGLAINIRFVIVNYHWLKGMFDSHHPGKKVGDLRLTHAATCYGVPHLQRHGQKEDRETKVAHVLYNTQTHDFALVVSKVNMFQTLGFRTSPICIAPLDDVSEELKIVEVGLAESKCSGSQVSTMSVFPTKHECHHRGACKLLPCSVGSTRTGIVAAANNGPKNSSHHSLLLVGLSADQERLTTCRYEMKFFPIKHETLGWIHTIHKRLMSSAEVEDPKESITCLPPDNTYT